MSSWLVFICCVNQRQLFFMSECNIQSRPLFPLPPPSFLFLLFHYFVHYNLEQTILDCLVIVIHDVVNWYKLHVPNASQIVLHHAFIGKVSDTMGSV